MLHPKSKPCFYLEKAGEKKVPVWVYDNGGKTFDRFTAVILGDVVGMSEEPTHPLGFGQYCGRYGWRTLDRVSGGDGIIYHRGWGKRVAKEDLSERAINWLQLLAFYPEE